MARYYNMTGGILTVRLADGASTIVSGKSYLTLAPEQGVSSEVLRLVRKGLLKDVTPPAPPGPALAPVPIPASVVAESEPVKTIPDPEPAHDGSTDPVVESASVVEDTIDNTAFNSDLVEIGDKEPPSIDEGVSLEETTPGAGTRRGRRRKKRS